MLSRLLNSLYDNLRSRLGLALLALAILVNLGALLAVDRGIATLDEARERSVHSRNVTAESPSTASTMISTSFPTKGRSCGRYSISESNF